MEPKTYYCVTTRKFTLRCGQEERLHKTQELYNQVLFFYYDLFLKLEEQKPGGLSGLSSQQALRELEKSSIIGKDKQPVPYPIPWEKVPLYFRRAAVNNASAAARSYLGRISSGLPAGRARGFQKGVTFYKGMYRELSQNRVSLKVWDGGRWDWINCRLSGNRLPEAAEILSPSVALTPKGAFLLVPVKEQVADGRTARSRMQENAGVCSVQFTNGDAFAVGVMLDAAGVQKAVRFFKGGMKYQQLCHELREKIEVSETAMGISSREQTPVEQTPEENKTKNHSIGDQSAENQRAVARKDSDRAAETWEAAALQKDGWRVDHSKEIRKPGRSRENNRYWRKLKHISEYYAHCISRQIVDFAAANQAEVIVLPKYDEKFTKYVMLKAGNWSPLHLSRKIRELVSYKAWREGMIVLEVNPGGTSAYCARCGLPVRKRDESYECPAGHRGNRHLNTARNLGKKCLRGFGREIS